MVYRPMGVPENISEGLCSQNYFHNIILHDDTKILFAIYTDGVKAIVSKIACTLVWKWAVLPTVLIVIVFLTATHLRSPEWSKKS